MDKDNAQIIRSWIHEYWPEIDQELVRWVGVLKENQNLISLVQAAGYECSKLINAINTLRNAELVLALV